MQDPFQTSVRMKLAAIFNRLRPTGPSPQRRTILSTDLRLTRLARSSQGPSWGRTHRRPSSTWGGVNGFGVEYYMFALGERIPVLVEEVISSPGVHLDVVFPATGST